MRRLDLSKNEYKHSFGTVTPLDACWVNKIVRISAWRPLEDDGLFGALRRFNEREWIYEARRKGIKVTEDDPYAFAEAMSPPQSIPLPEIASAADSTGTR
jgi:hypothetical protein